MSSIVSDPNAILDRERFHALWLRCFPLDQAEGAMPVWGNIVKRYGERHRCNKAQQCPRLRWRGLHVGYRPRQCWTALGAFFSGSKNLRAELSGISDKRFYAAKLTFLNDLLQQPRIYFTEFFFTKYEVQARENISRCAGWLESQGYCKSTVRTAIQMPDSSARSRDRSTCPPQARAHRFT